MWKWNLQITQKYTGGFDDHGITFALFHSLHIKMDTKLTKIELKNDSWGSSLTEIEKQMLSLSSIKYTINRIYGEDTEEVLWTFLQRKFKLDYEIQFERVHRVGKYTEQWSSPKYSWEVYLLQRPGIYSPKHPKENTRNASMSMSNSYPKSNRKEKYYTLLRGRLRKKKRTNVVRDIHILYINYKMHTPPQEPTPQLHRAWGQNLTGIPNVERQTLKRGNGKVQRPIADRNIRFRYANFIIECLWC